MDELISIVIPVYNAGKTIKYCVNSILNSTYDNFEILMVDDGSDKDTADQCDQLALADTRIKVIHQKNGGVSSARNCGLEKAKGNFITFVDADDSIDSHLLQCMMQVMKEEKADIVITGHKEWYGDGSWKECFCSHKKEVRNGKDILTDFFTTNRISWPVWGKLYKKSIIEGIRFKVGKHIAEDMYFNYEAFKNAERIVECGFSGYNYLKQNQSAMASPDCARFFDSFYLTKAVFDDVETDEEFKSQKAIFYLKNGLFFFRMIYAKDRNRQVIKEIEKAKEIFLDSLQGNLKIHSVRMKIELLLLQYFEPLYRLRSKIYWARKNM